MPFFLLAGATVASAQTSRADWPPELTERWDPEPTVVTPGAGAAAPSDAIILFDGSSLESWTSVRDGENAKWNVDRGSMTVVGGAGGVQTRQEFGSIQLHIEWRSPAEVSGDGQGRGNSGVFLQGMYEVQILDSYENRTYSNGQAGAVYKQFAPLVNAARAPGEWQTYDIFFESPVFDQEGQLVRAGFLTVIHNGVLIQHHVELLGPTEHKGLPEYRAHGKGPIMLQDHGNPVSYRNIWVREL